jgi:adenosylcobinamide-phosphate synthase
MLDNFLIIHGTIADPDRFPYVLAGFLVSLIVGMVTGPVLGNANSFWWIFIDKVFSPLGIRLDRVQRTKTNLFVRGLFFTLYVLIAAYILLILIYMMIAGLPSRGLTELIFLSFCLSSGSVFYSILKIYFSLEKKQISKGSFYTIAQSTRIDMSGQDDYTMTRTAMGYGVKAFDKCLVAPVFWYLIFGLTGAVFYSFIAGLAWRFGKEGFSKGFGKTALFLERLVGFIPHCLAALLISLAGLFTPTGGMTRSLIGQVWGSGKGAYHHGGLVLTALAYALDVSLGGPSVDLSGSAIKREWIGPKNASAQVGPAHLKRFLYILFMAHLLFFMSLICAMLWA